MHKRKLGAALLAVLAIAAVIAGCGGGSDSTSSGSTDGGSTEAEQASGEAPTKAQFIKEADAICAKADGTLNEEIAEFAEEKNIPITKEEPNDDQKVEIYESVVLPNVAKQGEEIGALTPPEGDEETIEDLVASLQSGVEDAEADPGALVDGDNPLEDASSKARDYGMKQCGNE